MGDDVSNSLVNLGNLSKPADTLIKKIFSAVGGIFEPYQMKRIAKAEVEADLIRAEGSIRVTKLHRRAMHRFINEEAKRQNNIEQITAQALPLLEENSNPDEIEDDWVTNFFDKCRIISDKDMQSLWSRVLSGEANVPGTYSKRTVNFLSDIDKADATLFSKLCGYGWLIGNLIPFIDDAQNAIYNENGIDFNALNHLESIGLIQFNSLAGFKRLKLPKQFTVLYYGQPVELKLPNDSDNSLEIGKVLLTKIGEELAPISGSVPVDGFKEYILEKWKTKNYIREHTPTYG